MSLLNLSLPELLALFSAVSGLMVTLYLLDRTRRRYTVSSLKFFTVSGHAPEARHRRRIQQPWSLLLQLLSMALLLLAIAQLRFGVQPRDGRRHILVLDTSAWMSAASPQSTPARPRELMDDAKAAARRWLATVPVEDPVMLVRAGATPTPVTPFDTDRDSIRRAIADSRPGAAVFSASRALQFALKTAGQDSAPTAEVVFAGAGRTRREDLPPADNAPSLRMLRVEGPSQHCGLRRVAVRRAPSDPDTWEVLAAARNYGPAPKTVLLAASFGGAVVGTRQLLLQPGSDQTASFTIHARNAGPLQVQLAPDDAFSADHRAVLDLSARSVAEIAVYSDEPDLLRPIFQSIPDVRAAFHPIAAWNGSDATPILVFDRFAPPRPPMANTIWIDPPATGSPAPVVSVAASTTLRRWYSGTQLGAGLRARDVSLANALIFRPAEDDIVVAEADAGPVIIARSTPRKTLVLGFHPLLSDLRYELAGPLLFANAVRWLAPESFRRQELSVSSVGAHDIDLEATLDSASISVASDDRQPVPWTLDGRTLRLFAANPGVIRIGTPDRSLSLSLTLPEPGDVIWSPRKAVYGLPPARLPVRAPRELWYWLALLGGVGLFLEWLLYARGSRRPTPVLSRMPARRASAWKKAS